MQPNPQWYTPLKHPLYVKLSVGKLPGHSAKAGIAVSIILQSQGGLYYYAKANMVFGYVTNGFPVQSKTYQVSFPDTKL